MSQFDDTAYHEWTSCEFYGHVFMSDDEGNFVCTDCGERMVKDDE